jgi:hypothetical protein
MNHRKRSEILPPPGLMTSGSTGELSSQSRTFLMATSGRPSWDLMSCPAMSDMYFLVAVALPVEYQAALVLLLAFSEPGCPEEQTEFQGHVEPG